jgi:hypothetical protein
MTVPQRVVDFSEKLDWAHRIGLPVLSAEAPRLCLTSFRPAFAPRSTPFGTGMTPRLTPFCASLAPP